MIVTKTILGSFTGVFIAVLFFSLTQANASQQEDALVEVLPIWRVDQKVKYELVKRRVKTKNGFVVLDMTARTDLEIEVLDANKDGYKLGWTFGETKFDDPGATKNPVVKEMSNLLKGQLIILELNTHAVVVGIENWEVLHNATDKMVATASKLLEEKGMDKAAIANIRRQITSMFSTKEQITQMCTREAQIMFMAVGVELDPSEPLVFSDLLPNPFGGESFPTRAEFALKEVNPAADQTTITWRQQFLPEESRRIMEASLEEMAKRTGKPVPDGQKLLGFSVEDKAEFVFKSSTGWLDHASHKRSTIIGDVTQEDTVVFKRKKEQ